AKAILASYRLGDMVTAETRAKSFRKEQPQQEDYAAQFDLEKGIYYLSVNNGQDALLAFQNVIDEYPESRFVDNARYGIGSAFAEAGDYEKAVEAFRTLVQESPDSDLVPSVYLKLGNIYHLQMNFEDAAFAYKRVIDDEGAGDLVPAALFNLIRTHEAANRQDQALHWAQELIRRFPDYEDARRVRIKIGYLHAELGHYTEAVTALEEVLPDVDAEEESEVRYWIGESYYDSGKYDQALLEYLKVAYLGQAGGLWALTAEFKAGQAYEALGRIDEARRLYRRMVERYGVDSQWGQAAQERLRELGG
ncbi:MAG: tetratricopeptide repeat protein, partial [Gemmatimonadota bacterium]